MSKPPTCSHCGNAIDLMSPSWRWNGERWEHKCPGADPQAGHFPAEPIEPHTPRLASCRARFAGFTCAKAEAHRGDHASQDAAGYMHTWENEAAIPEPSDEVHTEPMPHDVVRRLSEKQGHRCAICKESPGAKGWHVDHCHKTGNVRGLLCGRCNSAIGMLRDNPETMRAAAAYVESGGPARDERWSWFEDRRRTKPEQTEAEETRGGIDDPRVAAQLARYRARL